MGGKTHSIIALLLIGLMAGCASSGPGSRTATTVPPEDGGRGAYKVGNPYSINGIWYYPAIDYNYVETGVASWYGPNFHGNPTANGETFDQNALTAAHPTLPLPSIVRVTNLENGRSVKLRINDRGPFAKSRVIDVSRQAARLLGFERAGTAKVRVQVEEGESRQLAVSLGVRDALRPEPQAVPLTAVTAQALSSTANSGAIVTDAAPEHISEERTRTPAPELDGVVTTQPVQDSSIYIQVGAFVQRSNALGQSTILQGFGSPQIVPGRVGDVRYYRVRLGPYADVASADRVFERLVRAGHEEARMIVD